MAIFCLATSITDLKERLGRIIVGYTRNDEPVTAHDLHAEGAMCALLKDALKPNLVHDSLKELLAFVHGGPFANIAHGCNSIMATRMVLLWVIIVLLRQASVQTLARRNSWISSAA